MGIEYRSRIKSGMTTIFITGYIQVFIVACAFLFALARIEDIRNQSYILIYLLSPITAERWKHAFRAAAERAAIANTQRKLLASLCFLLFLCDTAILI